MADIKKLAAEILEDGKITKEEYQQFLQAVNEDGVIDAEEKIQIDKIYKLIKEGKIVMED